MQALNGQAAGQRIDTGTLLRNLTLIEMYTRQARELFVAASELDAESRTTKLVLAGAQRPTPSALQSQARTMNAKASALVQHAFAAVDSFRAAVSQTPTPDPDPEDETEEG